MNKRQIAMLVLILVMLYCCYHVPYKIDCPSDCQIEIDIPDEQSLILNDEERDEALDLLNRFMIRRRFTLSHSYPSYPQEHMYDDNYTYVHVFVGEEHVMKYQILVIFDQHRIIVDEFFREPQNFKEVAADEASIEEFVSHIEEQYLGR